MSKPELIAEIQDEIKQSGPIPFLRFMELALYHPKYGYYTTPGEKIGWRGDFYTSSTVHPIFGELLAKQFVQMGAFLENEPFTIVEVGAGKGTLCSGILRTLREKHPAFFESCRYVIVETSAFLKEKQRERLSPLFPKHIVWEAAIPEGLCGVIFSNELLDALPMHRLRVEKEHIQEIFVGWKENTFVEVLGPPSSPALSDYLERLNISFDKPVELEINLRALDWIASAGQALSKGFILTIDYGYAAADLYTPRRPKGTFLCYHKHKTNENPYVHVGEQDMTAHVDFTSVARRGENAGLQTLGFTDQMHFLMGLGIAQKMEAPAQKMHESESAKKEFLAMKQLMNPAGMGHTFKVLVQVKNISGVVQLDGLQYNRLSALD